MVDNRCATPWCTRELRTCYRTTSCKGQKAIHTHTHYHYSLKHGLLRSETLYRLSTLSLASAFGGSSLGAALLNVNVWLLSSIGIAIRFFAIPLLLLFPAHSPESELRTPLCAAPESSYSRLSQTEGEQESLSREDAEHVASTTREEAEAPSRGVSALFEEASLSSRLLIELLKSPLTCVTLLIYLVDETAIYVRLAFPQWAAKRFRWSLAAANSITSFQIVVNAAMLIVLPHLSRLILRPILHSQQRVDFWVIRSSLALNVVGIICAGMAPLRSLYVMSLLVYNLGSALTDALRSFVTSTTREQKEVERLYMGITMVETMAGLLGTTVWSSLFSACMRYGGITLGRVPFFLAGALFGLSWWLTGVLHNLATMKQLEFPENVDR